MKVSDIDGVELDEKGAIKDAAKLTESVKTEWADFITTQKPKGADVSNPPANNPSEPEVSNLADALRAKYNARKD